MLGTHCPAARQYVLWGNNTMVTMPRSFCLASFSACPWRERDVRVMCLSFVSLGKNHAICTRSARRIAYSSLITVAPGETVSESVPDGRPNPVRPVPQASSH